MQNSRHYIALCLLAFLIPMLPVKTRPGEIPGFPGWPQRFEGRVLKRLPLTERETGFYRDFPGKVARFSDGSREIVLRWVSGTTRKLHPAADCFKGAGYRIEPQPVVLDNDDNRWGGFMASRDGAHVMVKERIYDQVGNNWTDVSSWYWSAILDSTRGPWWVATVATRAEQHEEN